MAGSVWQPDAGAAAVRRSLSEGPAVMTVTCEAYYLFVNGSYFSQPHRFFSFTLIAKISDCFWDRDVRLAMNPASQCCDVAA